MKNKVVYNKCFGGFGLSNEAIEYLAKRGYLQAIRALKEERSSVIIARHDPLLIEVVEVLKKKANGYCAELKIAEIEGNLYQIDEYDGAESVITPEDQEWIEIKG